MQVISAGHLPLPPILGTKESHCDNTPSQIIRRARSYKVVTLLWMCELEPTTCLIRRAWASAIIKVVRREGSCGVQWLGSATGGSPIFLQEDLPMTTGIDLAVMRTKARVRQWRVAAELGRSGPWLSQIENQYEPIENNVVASIMSAIMKVGKDS